MRKVTDLPNGHELFVRDTEQGREYWSGEIGGGVMIWHTALCDESTLMAAMVEEHRRQTQERWQRQAKLRSLVTGTLKKDEI